MCVLIRTGLNRPQPDGSYFATRRSASLIYDQTAIPVVSQLCVIKLVRYVHPYDIFT